MTTARGLANFSGGALLTYNNDNHSEYAESGALVPSEMALSYIETNLSVLHEGKEQRKHTHDPCDWRQAYEANTDCGTVQNGYEANTCAPTCDGFWEAHWSATLQLFNDEGEWVDWPPQCTASNQQVLTCSGSGYAQV